MNARQRFIETLTFGRPDRIPLQPGEPRESTLAAWHAQGLPQGVHWRDHLLEVLGIESEECGPRVGLDVDFRLIPQFEEKVLQHRDGRYVVQDWKGNVCEISDHYDVTYLRYPKDFVTRRWLRCPVQGRADWEAIRERYSVDAPGRFPSDFQKRCAALAVRDYPLVVSLPGPFWQLREWCGFEGLCIMMVDQPEFVEEMAAFWTAFVEQMLGRIFSHVVPDMVHLSEDMAYKGHCMISPAMVERFCMPSYRRWSAAAKSAGVPLVGVDSDGYVADLLPSWIASGLNVCDPVEVAAHNDINEYRRRFGRAMAYRGGIDKRAIARGGKALADELRRVEPVIRDGGYVPGCDHGVPPDVSWPNFVEFARLLASMTGWTGA